MVKRRPERAVIQCDLTPANYHEKSSRSTDIVFQTDLHIPQPTARPMFHFSEIKLQGHKYSATVHFAHFYTLPALVPDEPYIRLPHRIRPLIYWSDYNSPYITSLYHHMAVRYRGMYIHIAKEDYRHGSRQVTDHRAAPQCIAAF